MTVGDNLIASWAHDLFELEDQIEALQDGKKDLYASIRDEHGKQTANALKRAVKLARMDSEKRDEADALDTEAFRILSIIERGTVNATHVRHAPREAEQDPAGPEPVEPSRNAADSGGESGMLDSPAAPNSQASGTESVPSPNEDRAPSFAGVEGDVNRHPIPDPLGIQAAEELVTHPVTGAPSSPQNIVRLPPAKPLRPWCQHQDDLTKCGGYGKVHCGDCLKAHADDVGLTA